MRARGVGHELPVSLSATSRVCSIFGRPSAIRPSECTVCIVDPHSCVLRSPDNGDPPRNRSHGTETGRRKRDGCCELRDKEKTSTRLASMGKVKRQPERQNAEEKRLTKKMKCKQTELKLQRPRRFGGAIIELQSALFRDYTLSPAICNNTSELGTTPAATVFPAIICLLFFVIPSLWNLSRERDKCEPEVTLSASGWREEEERVGSGGRTGCP